MSNLEKLNNIFCEVFSVDASALGPDFDNKTLCWMQKIFLVFHHMRKLRTF